MSEDPKLSDAEWKILSILWDHYPLSAHQIVEKLGHPGDDDALNKTKVQLFRLVKKEAISKKKSGREFVYSPMISARATIESEAARISANLPESGLFQLVSYFLANGRVNSSQADKLRKIIDTIPDTEE